MLPSDRPFTRREALAAGVTDAQLRGQQYVRLFHGVYVFRSVTLSLTVWLRAALLVLPRDTVVSHVTALHLYGLAIGEPWPLHLSTRSTTHSRQKKLMIHQRLSPISDSTLRGIPVTAPNRTLVDIATKVSLVDLVTAAEWMIHRRLTTLESVAAYAVDRHLDGVRKLRSVLGLLRDNVESPRETVLRLMIVFARLPEPRCNVEIFGSLGRFLARGDLVYVELKIVVEYDGWYHERDASQRRYDIRRRESIEAEGWRVIIVTSDDMDTPRQLVNRIHAALVERGWIGRPPQFSTTWSTWFPTT